MKKSQLKKEAELVQETLQRTLELGQEVIPMLVVIFNESPDDFMGKTPGKKAVIGLGFSPDTKDAAADEIGNHIHEVRDKVDAIVFGSDTWMVKVDKEIDMENMPRPSEHPERVDGIISTATTPDLKKIYSIAQTYSKTNSGIEFDEEEIIDELGGQYFILERFLGLHGN